MKFRRIVSGIAVLLAILSSPSGFAAKFYGGFFTSGLYATTQYHYFNNCLGPCVALRADELYENTLYQYGFGGGADLGIWVPTSSGRFAYGFVLNAMFSTGNGTEEAHNDLIAGNTGNTIPTTKFSMRENYNLAFQWLMNITDRFASYVLLGPSATKVKVEFTSRTSALPGNVGYFPESTTTNRRYYFGWVFGVGLMTHLTPSTSLFFEYDRMEYGSHSLPDDFTTLPNQLPDRVQIRRRYQDISANAIKFGVNFVLAGS